MSYLEQLKLENTHPEALPKLPEPPFDSFDSRGGRHFPEKKAPVAVVALATPDGPRTIEAPGPDRITAAAIYQGQPTPEAIDQADAILSFVADHREPVSVEAILGAVDGDHGTLRAIMARLTVDGILEQVEGLRYRIPAWPPAAPALPVGCPLRGDGPHPSGCCFHPKLLARLLAEGALPLPGGRCPLRGVCKVGSRSGSDGET